MSTPNAGALYCWGTGRSGEAGPGADAEHVVPFPTRVPLPAPCLMAGCGDGVTFALLTDGTVWGFGSPGRSGAFLGRTTATETPGLVPGLQSVRYLSVGEYHAAAVMGEEGLVATWGNTGRVSLGDGNGVAALVLHNGSPLRDAARVECGFGNTAAILRDGALLVWGANTHCKSGVPGEAALDVPTRLDIGGPAATVALGSVYGAATRVDGALLTWGCGRFGNLGHGDRRNRSQPTVVAGLSGQHVVHVSCTAGQINPDLTIDPAGKEGAHTAAVTRDGAAYAFGTCHKGVLGNHRAKILAPPDGDELTPYRIGAPCRDDPAQPSGYLGGAVAVASVSSALHQGILTADGALWVSGCGSGGRMGVQRYMTGLHGARSRMKCYVSTPTAIETFAEGGLRVLSVSTNKRHMAAVVSQPSGSRRTSRAAPAKPQPE